ncbi:MAG: hypothetical protein AAFQ79_04385 [Pseudomonadota bacterium]
MLSFLPMLCLLAVTGVCLWALDRAKKRLDEKRGLLSDEDYHTFTDRYAKQTQRDGMPERFRPYAEEHDRFRDTFFTWGSILLVATIIWLLVERFT